MKHQVSTSLIIVALIAMLAILFFAIVFTHLWLSPYFPVRHVNPASEVEQHPLSGFMTLLYLSTIDSIMKGDYKAVDEGLRALNLVYIPENFRFIANRFHALLNATWNLINEMRTLLDKAEALVNLGRGTDAKPILQEALGKYERVRSIYLELELASRELVRAFGLQVSELLEKINELEETIEGLYSQLIKLLEIADLQLQLKDTFLVVDVEPKQLWTGGSIEVRGKLHTVEGSLSGRLVKVYVDDFELISVETLEDGSFVAEASLPYIYKPVVTIQARYIPQGIDSQLYKPAVSNNVSISLLYIQPKITLTVTGSALPGQSLTVRGVIEGEGMPPYNQVNISWMGFNLTADLSNGIFSLKLRVPEEVAEGSYPLVVNAPAFEIYAPAQEVVYVNITRIPLNVKLQIPSIMIAGLPLTVRGEVLCEDSDLNVSVKIVISSHVYTSSSNGELKLTVTPPLTVLSGHHVCEVYVLPALPWYKGVYLRERVLVINPLTSILVLGLIATLMFSRSRSRRELEQVKPLPEIEKVESKLMSGKRSIAPELEWLIDLYWQAVVIVTKLTGVEMAKSMTMREYLASVSPKLGGLKSSFETLTLVAEKALYARTVTIDELELAKKSFEVIRLAEVKTEI